MRPGAGDLKVAQRLRERHDRRTGVAGFSAFAGDNDSLGPPIQARCLRPDALGQNQRFKFGLFQTACLSTGVKTEGLCQLMSRLMNSWRGTCDTAARLTNSGREEDRLRGGGCRYRYRRSVAGECSRLRLPPLRFSHRRRHLSAPASSPRQSPSRRRSACRQSSGKIIWRSCWRRQRGLNGRPAPNAAETANAQLITLPRVSICFIMPNMGILFAEGSLPYYRRNIIYVQQLTDIHQRFSNQRVSNSTIEDARRASTQEIEPSLQWRASLRRVCRLARHKDQVESGIQLPAQQEFSHRSRQTDGDQRLPNLAKSGNR